MKELKIEEVAQDIVLNIDCQNTEDLFRYQTRDIVLSFDEIKAIQSLEPELSAPILRKVLSIDSTKMAQDEIRLTDFLEPHHNEH